MMAQSWAQQAEEAAAAAGISPTALASVCVMESGCTNNAGAPASGGTISGIFQMSDGTYQQMMQEVSAANPNLQIDTAMSRLMLKSAKRASLIENLRSLRGLGKMPVR
jgi:hypothetical protein